jgi:hypothetical protein
MALLFLRAAGTFIAAMSSSCGTSVSVLFPQWNPLESHGPNHRFEVIAT